MTPLRDRAPAPALPGVVASPARRKFGFVLFGATLFLIFVGAEVKSRHAGLSVPDWPLSYGQVWPKMVGDVFYEHGHRTVASAVGLLTLILAIWTARTDSRMWVRNLGWVALLAVILQGVLGGLTVLNLLPTPVSATHATLAQVFLCLVGWLAYTGTKEWNSPASTDPVSARVAFRACAFALIAVFIQLLFGAWMRHSEAGLAVPFFPTSESGSLLPQTVDELVVIHMLHRGFAVIVLVLVLRAVASVARRLPEFGLHATLIASLVLIQVMLGALVIWEEKSPIITSIHVMNGANPRIAHRVLLEWSVNSEIDRDGCCLISERTDPRPQSDHQKACSQ